MQKYLIKAFCISVLLFEGINFSIFIIKKHQLSHTQKTSNFDSELGWNMNNIQWMEYNDIGIRSNLSKVKITNLPLNKIIFLGNSVVSGNAVELDNTFVKIFEKNLNHKEVKYHVINCGLPGYEIYQEFKKYYRDLSDIKVDYLIWVPSPFDFKTKRQAKYDIQTTSEIQNISIPSDESICYFGYNLISAEVENNKRKISDSFIWSEHQLLYTRALLQNIPEYKFTDMRNEIIQLNSYLKQRSVKLIVLFIPPQHYCRNYSFSNSIPYNKLMCFLDSNKIDNINLFDKLPCNEKDIFVDCTHFNALGHQFVGNLLYKEFEKMKLKLDSI